MLRAVLSGFAAVLLSISTPGFAASGYVHDLTGQATATDKAGAVRSLAIGDLIDSGSTIRTSSGGNAVVKFEDGQVMVLREKSAFRVVDYSYDKKDASRSRAVFNLISGGLRYISGIIGSTRRESFKLTAGNVTIGIRGTDGDTTYDAVTQTVTTAVNAGAVIMNSQFGSQLVAQNFFAFFLGNNAPVLAPFSQAPEAVKAAVTRSLNQSNVPVNTPVVVEASAKAAVAAAQARVSTANAARAAEVARKAQEDAEKAKGTADAERLANEAAQIKAISDRLAQVAEDARKQADQTLGSALDAAKSAYDAAVQNGYKPPAPPASSSTDVNKPATGAGTQQSTQGTSSTPSGGAGGGAGGGGTSSPN